MPVSVTRSYVYDGNHLLCKTVEPETGATIQSLDGANNVAWRAAGLAFTSTSSCDAASVPGASKVAFTYDGRNRVTGTGFGDRSPSIGRAYTGDGLPLTIVSNGSTWTYTYNNRRLLTQESLSYGGVYNIGWVYDANGNVSQLSYPDGSSFAYSPNALGEAGQVGAYASGVTYQPNGAVAGYTLGNLIVHSQTQNTRGLSLQNRDAGVMQDQYTYDANANVTAITDQQEGVSSRTMGYDGLDRLTTANAPGVWSSGSYSYDPLDNVRTIAVGSRNSTLYYDAFNRLSNINTNGTYTGYAYDLQGNVTGRGTQGFYFDQGNRMQLANGVASYAYDGLGRRTGLNGIDGVYRLQVYSRGGQLLYGIWQKGMTVVNTRYVYLGGKQIAETSSTTGTTYVHTDALGSPVARTNPSAGLLSRTRYEAYGNTAAGTVPAGIGFTGHVNDPDTGLVYMQQRYYDPVAGRFLSTDPVTTDANTGSAFNRFNYANNNPYRFTDPDGRESLGEFIDRRAQEAANSGNGLATFGWSFAGAAWSAFGAEGISQIADKGAGASTGDKVSAGVELLAVVPGGKVLGEAAAAAKETVTVQRWMSKAELEATRETGLLRGGKDGTHYVTDAANADPLRARQRLALDRTPEVRATLEVPSGALSTASRVNPKFNMPGGGMQRTATGNVPARVIGVD